LVKKPRANCYGLKITFLIQFSIGWDCFHLKPVGLRNCNAPTFSPLEKTRCALFSNPAFGVTGVKEVAYAVTGGRVRRK